MAYMRDSEGRRLDSIEVPARSEVVTKPGTRVAAAPLTAPNGVAAAAAFDLTQRTILALPVRATRWRIGFANRNLRATTDLSTPCTVTGIWTGAPARATTSSSAARWVGNIAGSVAHPVTSPLTVPVDSSRVWSPWIESDPFERGVEKVISWGFTSTNSGNGIANGNSTQGVSAAGAANAGTATLTGPTVSTSAVRLDVVIEYEFADTSQVLVVLADSNGIGFTPDAPQGIAGGGVGALPHESWPMVLGALTGAVVVNLSVGSATTANLDPTVRAPASTDTDYFARIWDRIPAGLVADEVIVSIGTNGLGEALNAWVARLLAINTKIRTDLGVVAPWWTTITPRCDPSGVDSSGGAKVAGYLTAAVSVGATSLTTDFAPANGTMLVGLGNNMEDVTVSAVTGSGPYTVTVAATTKAHYAGEVLAQGNERNRRYRNNFLRAVPDGVRGVLDFERLMEASPTSFVGDPRYTGSDWLHFYRSASPVRAQACVGTVVQPKLTT